MNISRDFVSINRPCPSDLFLISPKLLSIELSNNFDVLIITSSKDLVIEK